MLCGFSTSCDFLVLALGGYFFFFAFAGASYFYFFRWKRELYYPTTLGNDLSSQIRVEIGIAARSIPIMAILMAPFTLAVQLGYTRVYRNVEDYGWPYLFISIVLFLLLTDMMILSFTAVFILRGSIRTFTSPTTLIDSRPPFLHTPSILLWLGPGRTVLPSYLFPSNS